MPVLRQKVKLAADKGLGVIYFYWEGLWGTYAGPEGAAARQAGFRSLHEATFPDPYPRRSKPRD
jgi:hypothetical protein